MLREQYHHSRTMAASEYCKLVFDLSQQLREQDVEALKYMYKVSTENLTHLGVLKVLEKRGVFSSHNIQGLKTLLRNIERCDLLDMLREDKRLELCYLQAVSIEEKLEAIRTELASFCAKQECSPTERSFCSAIKEKVQDVQRGMEQFLTQPLKDVYQESTDGRICCKTRPDSTHLGRPEPTEGFSPDAKTHYVDSTIQGRRNKLAEVFDYDQLSPVGTDPDHVTSAATPYACTSVVDRERKKIPKHSIPLASSVPSTPLFALRKAFNRSSSSENLLLSTATTTQVSKLPVPKRRPSPNKRRLSTGGNENDSTSGGSGDSGFTDASEFALFKFDGQRTENLYSKPNKLTVNAPNAYSVPTKR